MTKHDDGFTPSLIADSRNLVECRISKHGSMQDVKAKYIVAWK
jgi:hypothetical protein